MSAPRFPLGARAKAGEFTGRVEAVFVRAEYAYMAQIAHRRVRLALKIEAPPEPWARPRVGRPVPRPSPHYFLVAAGGKRGAFVAERDLAPLPSRAAHVTPRRALGEAIVDPHGGEFTITAIYRRFASAAQAGIVSPGWFDVQAVRPKTRLQPFYGCTGDGGAGGVLVGEAEATSLA